MDSEACMATVSYFANSCDNLTLLRMFPCAGGALASNGAGTYGGEERMKQEGVTGKTSAMFMGEDGDGGDPGGGRWPRQETLTLLEVRARLDSRFRRSTQKAPLWDEVSRIMAEEYGYNRSGKKCKEKLENLYKYYKKTKQGKVGRHDGRHYRFFRQLEALYGDQGHDDLPIATQAKGNSKNVISGQIQGMHEVGTSTFSAIRAPSICESLGLSLSISTNSDSSSEEEEVRDDQDPTPKGQTYREESGFRELIDMQVRRLVEMQEIWLNKILKRIEQLEQDRISREEEWRRQEATRFELDQHMRNSEHARIKARDEIFIHALQRISSDREGSKFPQTGGVTMSWTQHRH